MVKQMEKIFKALGEVSRLKIVNMLSQKPMCVCEINKVLPLSQSTVSGHLRVLKEAGILSDVKDGLWVIYSLNRDSILIGNILDTVIHSFQGDAEMTEDRQKAILANREVLCKR